TNFVNNFAYKHYILTNGGFKSYIETYLGYEQL
ncbi:MAG: hypothetical protein ACI9U5_001872, partial [Colwellia sp.]